MHKSLSVQLTSIFSPLCQTLMCEDNKEELMENHKKLQNNCTELFIIRFQNNVIAYATFDVIDEVHIRINSLCFRAVVKDIPLTEYWLSRQLKSFFCEKCYRYFLQAS